MLHRSNCVLLTIADRVIKPRHGRGRGVSGGILAGRFEVAAFITTAVNATRLERFLSISRSPSALSAATQLIRGQKIPTAWSAQIISPKNPIFFLDSNHKVGHTIITQQLCTGSHTADAVQMFGRSEWAGGVVKGSLRVLAGKLPEAGLQRVRRQCSHLRTRSLPGHFSSSRLASGPSDNRPPPLPDACARARGPPRVNSGSVRTSVRR